MQKKRPIMRGLRRYRVGRGEGMTERVRIYGMCVAGHGWLGEGDGGGGG